MNDQLQNALVAIINKTAQGVDAGVTFLQAQVPDVIQQLLVWKMTASLLFFVGGVLGVGLSVILFLRFWASDQRYLGLQAEIDKYSDIADAYIPSAYPSMGQDELKKIQDRQDLQDAARAKVMDLKNQRRAIPDLVGPFYLIPMFGVILSALFLAIDGFTWLQIWIAPKLYLIEFAARLAKGG